MPDPISLSLSADLPSKTTLNLSSSCGLLNTIITLKPHHRGLVKVTFPMSNIPVRRSILLEKSKVLSINTAYSSLSILDSSTADTFLQITPQKRKRSEISIFQAVIQYPYLATHAEKNTTAWTCSRLLNATEESLNETIALRLNKQDFVLSEKIQKNNPHISALTIEFIHADCPKFLFELKEAIRLQNNPYQSHSTPLVDSFRIIQTWLKYTHLGGLKNNLLWEPTQKLDDIFNTDQIPSSLDALLHNKKFNTTMRELEANQDFVVCNQFTGLAPDIKMVAHLKKTKLHDTKEGKPRLAQQLGFILLRYQQCREHQTVIKNILIDVMHRCTDRAQRQLSTAVFKVALLATSRSQLSNNQVAHLLAGLYKEFIIDQVSITASGFSHESVEDALYLRKALFALLQINNQGSLRYDHCKEIHYHQRADLLLDVCYQFCCYDNLILFIREHTEMIDVLIAQVMPDYKLRIDQIHAELHELADDIDTYNFNVQLNHFLQYNRLPSMEFSADTPFYYYEHVAQQLKMDPQLPVLVVLKTLQEANFLDQRAVEFCPELTFIESWHDLYLLAQERIPWLATPLACSSIALAKNQSK